MYLFITWPDCRRKIRLSEWILQPCCNLHCVDDVIISTSIRKETHQEKFHEDVSWTGSDQVSQAGQESLLILSLLDPPLNSCADVGVAITWPLSTLTPRLGKVPWRCNLSKWWGAPGSLSCRYSTLPPAGHQSTTQTATHQSVECLFSFLDVLLTRTPSASLSTPPTGYI